MHFEILITRRLKLRKLTPDAFNYIFNHYDEKEIRKFFCIDSDSEFKKEKYKRGRENYHKNGKMEDSIVFSLLKSEYENT